MAGKLEILGVRISWSSPALFVASFAITIFIGSLLLWLPIATVSGESLPFIDALFQSTSAVCVTGLATVGVGTDLSLFGQIVILSLFQIGALGIMTYSLAIVGFVQQQGSPEQRDWLANVFTKDRKLPPSRMLAWIVKLTIAVEIAGALVLWVLFARDFGPLEALYMGVFHAVSAFCNAGFSLLPDSLVPYQSDISINLVMCGLIIVGGLGFVVTFEAWRALTGRRRWFKLLVQTKLVLASYVVLIVAGALFFLLFESKGLHENEPVITRILTALFQSTTARTAGFNTVDIGTLTNPSLLMMMVLMFIGGGPGSTAGGVKVTTAAVLALSVFARHRSNGRPQVFNRTVAFDTITRAAALVTGAVVIILVGTLLLQATELWGVPHSQTRGKFVELLFETVSAFGTVGLSTGITSSLTTAGRAVIVCIMFIGRIGPLSLAAILLGSRRSMRLSYPEEDVMIG